MRSTQFSAWGIRSLAAIGALLLVANVTQAQSPYVPGGSPSGTWGGYAPGYSWGAYAPGSAWIPYTPGTPTTPSVAVQPQPPQGLAVTRTAPPGTITVPGQTIYRTVPATSGRTLFNGVRNPVRGATPYADGRVRNYYEYGSGRNIPLAKPWLPGAPGG